MDKDFYKNYNYIKLYYNIEKRLKNSVEHYIYSSIVEDILKIDNIDLVNKILYIINNNLRINEVVISDTLLDNYNIIYFIKNLNSRIDICIEITSNNTKLFYINNFINIDNNILFKIKCDNLINNITFKNFIDSYVKHKLINTIYFYNDTWNETDKYLIKNNYFKILSINNSELFFNDEIINLIQSNNSINSITINCNLDENLIENIVKILQLKNNINSLDLRHNLKITSIIPLINILQNYNSILYIDLSMNNLNSVEVSKLKKLPNIRLFI